MGEQILLDFFRQFYCTEKLKTVSEPVYHVVGVTGNYAELIMGGYRDFLAEVAFTDLLQNFRFIFE